MREELKSGAGSDSDSGHLTSAVPCPHLSAIEAQIRRVESHPAAIVPEDLEAARKLWVSSSRPCIALVQRKLGIGYNYAQQLVLAIQAGPQ